MKFFAATSGVIVRSMRAQDAHAVAVVHTLSWQSAYTGIIDQKFLDTIDVQERERNWRKGIESNDPPLIRLVLEDDDRVVAFACGLDNRFQAVIPSSDAELWAIYSHPDYFGRGAGKALMKQLSLELRAAGKKRFCVWVLAENRRARKFYESQGGVLGEATKQVTIGKQALTEVAYEFELS